MAKGSKKTKVKVNVSRVIKLGAIAVFAAFAAILVYVSVFIWNTLSVIGTADPGLPQTRVQGINDDALTQVESDNERRMNGQLPMEDYPRNPFMPVGMQVPKPPEPELPPEPPEQPPATSAGTENPEELPSSPVAVPDATNPESPT